MASDNVEAILKGCLSQDNVLRKQAEAALKVVSKPPEASVAMLLCLRTSPDAQVLLMKLCIASCYLQDLLITPKEGSNAGCRHAVCQVLGWLRRLS